MFAALVREDEQCVRKKRRLFRRKMPPIVSLTEVPLGGMNRFYIISCQCGREDIPWSVVAQTAGRECNRMLLPYWARPPKGCGIKRYQTFSVRCSLLFNTFLGIFGGRSVCGLPITLVDINGEFSRILPYLVDLSSDISVVCARGGVYDGICETIYEESGAAISCAEQFPADCRGGVAISPRGLDFAENYTAVFCAENAVAPRGSLAVAPYGIMLPQKYARLKPKEISDFDFAAALVEHCGIIPTDRIKPRALLVNGAVTEGKNALEMLDRVCCF